MLPVKHPLQTFLRRSLIKIPVGILRRPIRTREVAENTPAGTNIGAPVVAGDTDVLTYSLDDPDTGAMSRTSTSTGRPVISITKVPLNHEETAGDDYTAMVNGNRPLRS